nr:hypothetical protein [uncultured Draconibacterium sp.]
MSIIAQKSEENYNAIDVLIKEDFKAPVVHCAYYSCLQLMIHQVYFYTGMTEEEVVKETQGQGSHNFYLSTFVAEIRKLNSRNAAIFYKFFGNFKRKRTEADYHNIEILERDVLEAKEYAEKIRIFLNLIENDGKCENILNL